jgi:AcrR family transcriptional regulator
MDLGQRTNSGQTGGTARRILEHAREAFNERGVAAVGVREIARDLDLSPGNVSYHYPTKEALVAALMREMHARNNALTESPPPGEGFEQVEASSTASCGEILKIAGSSGRGGAADGLSRAPAAARRDAEGP